MAIEAGYVCVNEELVPHTLIGTEVLLETRKVPVTGMNGEVIGVLGIARDISLRKKAEQTLAAREREFRSLAEHSPDVIVRYDRECRRIYVNPAWERVNGVAADEVIGKAPHELSPRIKSMASSFETMLRGVLKSGKPDKILLHWMDEEGEAVYFDLYATPEFDEDGKVISVLTLSRDITEHRKVEIELQNRYAKITKLNKSLHESQKQLQLTEAWYRDILHSAPDGMVVINQEGIIQLVNQQLARMFGYEADELIGTSIELLVPLSARDGHAKLRASFVQEDAGNRPMADGVGRLSGLHKNGHEFAIDISLARLPDIDGQGAAVCAAVRDISERKRLENELAVREQEFRTLVENASDTVARYGVDMRRVYANPAFADLVEGGADVLIGKKPSEWPGGETGVAYEAGMLKVLISNQPHEMELEWRDKGGKQRHSLISLTPEFDKHGEVVSILAVGRDITELNNFRQKIHQMAFYDTLTGLPNRALFNDRLNQMVTDAAWHGHTAGVMMIDLDHFKEVNDSLGHAAGDELLCETASRLSECVRAYDTVARLGGDEFSVLLPDIRSGDDLGRVASKMLSMLNRPFILEGKEVFVSGSVGIATFPEDGHAPNDLLKFADSAMYFAKRSGRNNFRFYSRDLTESSNERLMLESDLRRAIERHELLLYYQPKISLASNHMIGSEALLRWMHPTLGMVPPDKFINIAEDSGQIVEIGEWVLREACRTAVLWNRNEKQTHKVAINLSPRQFQSPDLFESVCSILEESGCRTEWIELEITESLLLEEGGDILNTLESFRSMGITIAIDDFGTGYSALSYLARFPINTLKIDRSFTNRVTDSDYHAEVVRAILSIAESLGQKVVAEGVETLEQARFLQEHGCHIAQGYLFGKPLPQTELESRLHQGASMALL